MPIVFTNIYEYGTLDEKSKDCVAVKPLSKSICKLFKQSTELKLPQYVACKCTGRDAIIVVVCKKERKRERISSQKKKHTHTTVVSKKIKTKTGHLHRCPK